MWWVKFVLNNEVKLMLSNQVFYGKNKSGIYLLSPPSSLDLVEL